MPKPSAGCLVIRQKRYHEAGPDWQSVGSAKCQRGCYKWGPGLSGTSETYRFIGAQWAQTDRIWGVVHLVDGINPQFCHRLVTVNGGIHQPQCLDNFWEFSSRMPINYRRMNREELLALCQERCIAVAPEASRQDMFLLLRTFDAELERETFVEEDVNPTQDQMETAPMTNTEISPRHASSGFDTAEDRRL
ncbi:unnamed protein product, partial [Protopolystoma xenopodis]